MDARTPPWDELDEGTPRRRGSRRGALLTIGLAPWLLLGVVLLRGATGDASELTTTTATPLPVGASDASDHEDPTPSPDETPDAGDRSRDAQPPQAPLPPATDGDTTTALPGPDDTASDRAAHLADVTDGDAGAVAIAVARAWLSDEGAPDLEGPPVTPRRGSYLEHASVRRIEVIGTDLAVVTVGVLLLERDEGRYDRIRAADVLVPLTVTATAAHPAGPPWWGPRALDLTERSPVTHDDEDPTTPDRVAAALETAGYRDVAVHRVARTDDGLLQVTVEATTADGDVLDGALWLAETSDGPQVLGSPTSADARTDRSSP